jgi:hypothetical protein
VFQKRAISLLGSCQHILEKQFAVPWMESRCTFCFCLGATASCCYEAAAATAIFVLGADGGWVKLIFFERRLCVIVGRCC